MRRGLNIWGIVAAAGITGMCLTGCAGMAVTSPTTKSVEITVSESGEGMDSGKENSSTASEKEQVLTLSQFGEELLKTVNEEHESVEKPQISVEDYIGQYSDESFDPHKYGVDMSKDYGADFIGDAPLTMEQVEEDLDVLFKSLKTTYGAYYYFGGDEVFSRAKNAVLNGCRKTPKSQLSCNTLVSLLLEELSFVKDGHFRIVGMGTSEPLIPYFYKGKAFEKTEKGYRALDSGKMIASVDGWENLDDLMKRSLSEDGQVVYYPIVLRGFSGDWEYQPEDLTVRYEDGSIQTLTAGKYESFYDQSHKTSEFRFAGEGVPLLFVRNMGFDEAKGDTVGAEFLAYLEQAKDEPVIIVDLRSNGGGNGILPFKWLNAYTGGEVTTNYISVKYWSKEDMMAYAENTENPYYVSYESMTKLGGYTPVSDYYTETNGQPDHFTDNDKLLIILTGKNTASSAETFTDIAHNVRNTIIIGENTYGMLISNAYMVIALPNSHTPVQFGSDLSIFPENETYFQEFTGLQPDFWTEGKDAEKRAVELIKRMRQ